MSNSQKVNSAAAYNRVVGCSERPSANPRLFVRKSQKIKMDDFKQAVALSHAKFFKVRKMHH